MQTTGLYKISVRQRRAETAKAESEARRAYHCLRDKSTPYAREIAELLALHGRAAAVWRDAPDDIGGEGGAA